MTQKILKIVDCTLRDGEQAPGLALGLESKKTLAALLDRAGVFQIEAGTPAMGHREMEAIAAVKSVCQRALISTWNRTRKEDILASIKCKPDIIHICLPVSEIQLNRKLKITLAAALDNLALCVALIRDHGYEVSVGLEDAFRAEEEQLKKVATAAYNMGLIRLRLSDTVGLSSPKQVDKVVALFKGADFKLEIHTHNDLGMAEANAARAALAGVEYVDTTIGGIGERTGNCNLAAFVRLMEMTNFKLQINYQTAREIEFQATSVLDRSQFLETLLKSTTSRLAPE